ncbi:ATP-binding protein [Pedobacter kyonggii]|uniref:ATP-binding protein n=1 Tax=Pedobacter kyonggii TaxID=1926871 RepID=A0A4Q9HCT6_9SPHI|nr:ATP-binding protein [Pedobacter kyonggii]TBO42228.1 ATP-binding protein [Pedobacter kyonggii]
MDTIIGREEEKAKLKDTLTSKAAELVAIYGRRRVGKTFLIRQFYSKQIICEFSGYTMRLFGSNLRISET